MDISKNQQRSTGGKDFCPDNQNKKKRHLIKNRWTLIQAIDNLKAAVDIPKSISEAGISKKKFYATLDEMSEKAFDDQCTGANPRYPLISEIKQMYINAFEGPKEEKQYLFCLKDCLQIEIFLLQRQFSFLKNIKS